MCYLSTEHVVKCNDPEFCPGVPKGRKDLEQKVALLTSFLAAVTSAGCLYACEEKSRPFEERCFNCRARAAMEV